MFVHKIIVKRFCNNTKIPVICPVHLEDLFITWADLIFLRIYVATPLPWACKLPFQVLASEQPAGSFPLGFPCGSDLAYPSHPPAPGCWDDRSISLTFVPVPQGHLLSLFAWSPLEKSSFVLPLANKFLSQALLEGVRACPMLMVPQKTRSPGNNVYTVLDRVLMKKR